MNKNLLSVFLVGLACSAGAATISVDRVQQRYPWNGLVDIDYTVSGIEGDPCDYFLDFTMTVTGESGVRTIAASNFANTAWCDLVTSNGTWRASWDAAKDGVAERGTAITASATITRAPVTDADATFAIVDISSGPNSALYPVRYVNVPTNDFALFNADACKTDRIVLKKVCAGEFWMGEGDVSSGTGRHRVRLTKDYFLGLFEVTRGQIKKVLGDADGAGQRVDSSYQHNPFTASNTNCCPITFVAYNNIVDPNGFLAKLNARAKCRGQSVALFSLPTEAEWEYACRAGTETKFYYGSTTNDSLQYASMRLEPQWNENQHKWVDAVSPDQGYSAATWPYRVYAVGSFLPNAWGFYDMLGNVAEYCSDYFGSYPAYSEEGVTVDPTGPEAASSVITRGGCFWEGQGRCSSGDRYAEAPDGGAYNGFANHWGSRWGYRIKGGVR